MAPAVLTMLVTLMPAGTVVAVTVRDPAAVSASLTVAMGAVLRELGWQKQSRFMHNSERHTLWTLDRVTGNEIKMTQESIATTLGVQRERISEVASHLRTDGLIACRRGSITVMDRAQLEQRVCECYAVVAKEYEALLRDLRAESTTGE
jgi:hypothetical protein